MSSSLSFRHILTPDGFERHKRLVIDQAGVITGIVDEPGSEFDGWLALPGMPNAHSHSFQRALTGLGERAGGGDSFWSWRTAMYALADRITAEDLVAVSARAFADMLRGGFSSVAEFHYLHHRVDGGRGPDMARAVAEGARIAGIRLVLLPVLYQVGGFDRPASPGQRRFIHEELDDYLALLAGLNDLPLGIAPHSVRAVAPAQIAAIDEAARDLLGDGFPRHIHISEQRLEVRQCIEALGRTPIELLAEHVDLDEHWNLVHATHATDRERSLMLRAGVTAVLCPLTEAYLGDGIFAATDYVGAGGRVAVGSDSNIRIDAVEELRMLEYGQRLVTESRACLATGDGLGRPLWERLATGGGRALAMDTGRIEPGMCADLVVLDPGSPVLCGLDGDAALDALVTAGSAADIQAVYVGGIERVRAGRHMAEDEIRRAYVRVMDRLREGL
jgi:formimidoylglutamate deiminase